MPTVFAFAASFVPSTLRRPATCCAGMTTGITTHTISPVRPIVFA
ncbi:hypothetical protein [Xanthomonas theicola]|nr:hypothetical protein [Xanthomonas theicola]